MRGGGAGGRRMGARVGKTLPPPRQPRHRLRLQLWALYCLVLFYTATRRELAPIRPLSKFLVVKAVVFLSYWQGVAISVAVWAGVIKASDWAAYTAGDVAAGLQEFLICVEMFFAALAHACAWWWWWWWGVPTQFPVPTRRPPPPTLQLRLSAVRLRRPRRSSVGGRGGQPAGRPRV